MEEPTVISPVSVAAEDDTSEQSDSILSQLAAKQKTIANTKETFINVPGYDSAPPVLQIKYRLLTGPDFNRIAENVRMEFKGNRWERQLMAGIDTCLEAMSGFYVEMSDGTSQPLTYQGDPITACTAKLAEALQFIDRVDDPLSHRQVFMGLFGGNETMIGRHVFQLNRWMSDVSVDVNEDFLGNL